ncbi:Mu transposase C-terminal domain-containing protein [Hydrocarboniphaga effusa]|uniref:Mu transposase C-terminal domain-containing protein n=1 Tax=Hydrocarboniphaga effusa TaxID=243629 RepID=UPI003BA99C7F
MRAAILPFEPRLPLLATPDPVSLLPEFARTEAERRLQIIGPALARIRQGCTIPAAAAWLEQQGAGDTKTLDRYIRAYTVGGLIALAPKHKGRIRKEQGWEALAMELYATPTHPAYSTVALWLREKHGFATATEHAVRRFLKSVPSNAAETSPKRLGKHYYQQNVKPYVLRDNTVLPVGFIYEGDGHTCDVYVADPRTGNPYRPELTVWVDVRSHYVVGWWLSESESANTTMFSLSHALLKQDHVPAMLHADVGSGYVAKTISDAQTGFLARFSIECIFALPGNAKGKGLIEGFWRWFEERCGKQFATFCGHDRTDDYLRHLTDKVKRGIIQLPTLQQYADAVRDYFDFYNRNPQKKGIGCAPRDLWAELQRVPVETPSAAVMRPREKRTVRRWGIALHNRIYRGGELAQYEGREVTVAYDLHNDMIVWVEDAKGRLICEAKLVEKHPWLPDSRIEEAQQKRLAGQQQRLENKLAEFQGRARTPISAAAMLDRFDEVTYVRPIAQVPAPVAYLQAPEVKPEAVAIFNELQQDQLIPEDAYERFELWQRLQACINNGDTIDPELAEWATSYATQPECTGFQMALSDFNT